MNSAAPAYPVGIGIDSVDIAQFEDVACANKAFILRTFSNNERKQALQEYSPYGFLAARLAAKEAAFKAVAPLLEEKTFDLRVVEALKNSDGSPYYVVDGQFALICKRAGVDNLLLSITDEAGVASAIALALRKL